MVQTLFDGYRYRFILQNLVSKNLKSMYRNMALGFLWSLLNPLVMVVVLSLVWTTFMQADPWFPSFVMVAMVPYNFFSYCLSGCAHSILGNASLVKKVAFPRQILPFSVVATHVIHFAIQFPLVIGVLAMFPGPDTAVGWHLLWLPVVFVVQVGLVLGVGLLVAGLNVIYRDVQYVVDSALLILFWGSPILYDRHWPQSLPMADWPNLLYYLNPLAGIFDAYRAVLFYGRAPDFDTFGMAVMITLAFGIWGVWSFWRNERTFADLI